MREWLKGRDEIDVECVHRYEYLLGRKLKSYEEYREIDGQVDEMILEWGSRGEFFKTYPKLRRYQYDINPDDYTIEYCPFCESEQVIYSTGVTACPECGKPLAPCSMCESCDYDTCPYGCTGGAEDEFKEITNPPISKRTAKKIYELL